VQYELTKNLETMSKVVALANQKGGVGKTTSTINLAYALAQKGQRVLAIDFDPQGSLTIYFGFNPDELEEQERTMYFSLMNGKPLESMIIGENPALLPASISLANAEPELITNVFVSAQGVLREKLKGIRDSYDVILIDCAPSLGLLTVNALVAADLVLVPVKTDNLSFHGVARLFQTIGKIQSGLNPNLRVIGVLPTQYNPRNVHDNEILDGVRIALAEQNVQIFDPVNRSTAFDKATSLGKPTIEVAPETPGVQSYNQVADAIIQIL
jgi:chromosome partitioning protein